MERLTETYLFSDRPIEIWQLILRLLNDSRTNPHLVRWVNREEGVFEITNMDYVAWMWRDRNIPWQPYPASKAHVTGALRQLQ